MSQRPISRSDDLRRLREDGYDISIDAGYLVVRHVPYVTTEGIVDFGIIACSLALSDDDRTARPDDHTVRFGGSIPCDSGGRPLDKVINSSGDEQLTPDLLVNHSFSSKPPDGYPDYYIKITTYVAVLESQAQAIDPCAKARVFAAFKDHDDESVFRYTDNASSRAGIVHLNRKLELANVAIVGLGGTGSYVLDLISKAPIRRIHLYDGDPFLQHNAFRAPGPIGADELKGAMPKADFYARRYDVFRGGLVTHPYAIDATNVHELADMDFVFICIDRGNARKLIAEALQANSKSFIDVGMGVEETEGSLAGILRTTTSTPEQMDHFWAGSQVPLHDTDEENEYSRNIQLADLNALNGALAVVKFKKLFGFYRDLEREHSSLYTLDGNHVLNKDAL